MSSDFVVLILLRGAVVVAVRGSLLLTGSGSQQNTLVSLHAAVPSTIYKKITHFSAISSRVARRFRLDVGGERRLLKNDIGCMLQGTLLKEGNGRKTIYWLPEVKPNLSGSKP